MSKRNTLLKFRTFLPFLQTLSTECLIPAGLWSDTMIILCWNQKVGRGIFRIEVNHLNINWKGLVLDLKNIMVRSVFDAFEYVMQHYYPAGMKDMVEMSDTYAVISIQDTHTDGFGVTFSRNQFCKDVLTLQFDDIIRPVEGAQLFTEDMAEQIINFINANQEVDTLMIHCYAGQSRSRAVGAFAVWLLGGDNSKYFENYNLNDYVYDKLVETILFPHKNKSVETDENL